MIKYNYEVSVNENRAKLNKDIFLFRGNRNIHYYFSIKGARFAFEKEGDLIENANAIYAAVTVIKPNGVEVANAIAPVENGLIHLKVTEDLIDEEVEIGDFDLVFDLFDDSDGAVTIPKIKGQFHVQERPCTTSIGTLSGNVNVVNQAVVDLAIATQENEQLIVVDDDGKYVKTTWAKGNKISVERLNKMEEGIYNNSSQLKDIAKQISNIKTDVEVTKDITVLTNDNTSIPTTTQQQEVTVEFTKGTIIQVPAFTNMITTSTTRQSTYMKNATCLNENELEYSANGTDTTGYFRYQLPSLSENHKIYCSIWVKTTASNCKAMCGTTNNFFNVTNEYTKISGIFTYSSGACYLGYNIQTMNSTDTYYMKKPLQIDLTTLYGEGNEPTLEEFEKLIGDNWCLGTYTPSETVSNDFTIKSYKSDNSLLDTFNSSTDTSINVIGGGYVNVTADVLPTSVILKNVKYTEKQNIGTATPSSPTKEFEGLKWGVVGDSLSDSSINADTKYHKIIKEKTGITIQELAKGGTGYTAGYSTNDTYYDRILTLDTDCDIVTIFGSVNDWKNNQYNSLCKEIGTISDTYDDSKSVIENTFYANLNRTFDALVDRVPKAQIIVFGAMPYYGVHQTFFKNVRDALIAVCKDRHIPYNDMFDSTGFYRIMNNKIYAQAYTTDYSGTNYDTQTPFGHPNNLAHKKIIAPMFLTELRKHLLL